MINYIKNDFRRVRWSLEYLVGRKIPVGIAILYYVIVGAITLPLTPLVWIGSKIWLKIEMRRLEKYFDSLGVDREEA